MKFLHMSDLHIGKSIGAFSMAEEQRRAFDQAIGCIRTEKPGAVLLAGDVYDRAVPGAEAVGLFDDLLTALAREGVAVLLIPGNHDSPERLGFAGRLLAGSRIYFCGREMAMRKVTLPDEYGEVNFWLMPYTNPAKTRGLFGGQSEPETHQEAVAAMLGAAGVDYGARNVLLSHQFYTKAGQKPERSDSELDPLGGLDAVDAGLIERFDYAALGHLHRGQSAGHPHIRYCGSPVKYSVSEIGHDKTLTLVELRGKGEPIEIRLLPLSPLRGMRRIKGGLAEVTGAGYPGREPSGDYIHVTLTDEEEIIGPMGKLRSVYPNAIGLEFENSRTAAADVLANAAAAPETESLSAYELFAQFFLESQGGAMSAEQAEIVREILERSEEE